MNRYPPDRSVFDVLTGFNVAEVVPSTRPSDFN